MNGNNVIWMAFSNDKSMESGKYTRFEIPAVYSKYSRMPAPLQTWNRRKKTVLQRVEYCSLTFFCSVKLTASFVWFQKNVESEFQFDWNCILKTETYLSSCTGLKFSQAKCALNFISRRPVSNRKARLFFKKWRSIQQSWHSTSGLDSIMRLASIADRRHNCPPRKLESLGSCSHWMRSMECPWFFC